MIMRVVAVIPARMESTRFPGKALYSYHGEPLLFRLCDQVKKVRQVDQLVVATDSVKVRRAAEERGVRTLITSKRHRTGSDRVAEAAEKLRADIVLNIQADTFDLKPVTLDRAINRLKADQRIRYATLARPVADDDELFDPGVVKVVVAADGRALWFSRFPLPYLQHVTRGSRSRQFRFLAHIGVYFFRGTALADFAGWKRSPHEKAESLEQLRILENGRRIEVFRTTARTTSINTPDDLKKITRFHR